jgi:hypothetical protein
VNLNSKPVLVLIGVIIGVVAAPEIRKLPLVNKLPSV